MFVYPVALFGIGSLAIWLRNNRGALFLTATLFLVVVLGFFLEVGQAILDYIQISAAESVARSFDG